MPGLWVVLVELNTFTPFWVACFSLAGIVEGRIATGDERQQNGSTDACVSTVGHLPLQSEP